MLPHWCCWEGLFSRRWSESHWSSTHRQKISFPSSQLLVSSALPQNSVQQRGFISCLKSIFLSQVSHLRCLCWFKKTAFYLSMTLMWSKVWALLLYGPVTRWFFYLRRFTSNHSQRYKFNVVKIHLKHKMKYWLLLLWIFILFYSSLGETETKLP